MGLMASPNPSLDPSLISSVFVDLASPSASQIISSTTYSQASSGAGAANINSMAADMTVAGPTEEEPIAYVSTDSRSRSVSQDIPSKIKYDGITYEVLRPEQLGCDSKDIPLFGERRSKARAAKHKKNQRRRPEETEWENKRKSTIEERLFNRAFAGYSESDLMVTGDGLLLPRLPSWLNSTRETQHDGSPGVFICSPSKEDFNSRFLEILEALEPIGVEIGVAKIRVPDGCLDDPIPWSEFKNRNPHSSLDPTSYVAQNGISPNTEKPPAFSNTAENSNATESHRRPKKYEYTSIIPPAAVDEMGIPQVFSMDQRLPLHPESSSSIAPIYHVTSTPKTLVSGTDWLKDINLQLERERRIAARDPSIQVYGSLQEETMVARGRDWREILTGDKGGVSKYSSDNDATEALRSYLGLKDPRLTELPGNIVHDSKHKVTGIHTPYLYIGQAYTLFALHAEDYNAFSLNYQHLGAPKTWRVVCPRDFYLVEGFVDGVLHPSSSSGKEPAKCSQFVRHASLFLPKETLETAGARSIQFSQNPGELVVTWPLAYHQGWNEGVNVNEACGYGHKGWRKVFGSGEDDQSEHKVYRPCGSRCIGDNAPIILSFGPEDLEGVVDCAGGTSDDTILPELTRKSMSTATTPRASASATGRRKRPRARELDERESLGIISNPAAPFKKTKVVKDEEEDNTKMAKEAAVFVGGSLEQDTMTKHITMHREQRIEGDGVSAEDVLIPTQAGIAAPGDIVNRTKR
ncbi:uncharacterized protein LAJ45_03813 [Morchella importuna]|uniref:uncharacterized protein n=1 Tax=Morchella importuna TaxID=1174673 RepID=UPI001E8D008B|nr:uncharacterized protein LAJ45_03813 [Morchella importuna]KAH8151822.1 hypothetical protein LAJ45_03813 [Morchella importuna]